MGRKQGSFHRGLVAPALALLAACGPEMSGRTDLGVPSESDAGPTDLSTPTDTTPAGPRFRYVVGKLLMPRMKTDYAFDLNGDSIVDNRLGEIAAHLAQAGVDLQASTDLAIVTGDTLELIALGTANPAGTDPAASVSLYVGQTQRSPDLLSGTGRFSIDTGVPRTAAIGGKLDRGVFTSPDVSDLQLSAPTATFRVSLLGASVNLPLIGVRVTFTATEGDLVKGQLNGAIHDKAIAEVFVKALATGLQRIRTDSPDCKSDAVCKKVMAAYDVNADDRIDDFELKDGPLKNLIAPAIDLIDGQGRWTPLPSSATPDSLPVGFGFTARRADFAE